MLPLLENHQKQTSRSSNQNQNINNQNNLKILSTKPLKSLSASPIRSTSLSSNQNQNKNNTEHRKPENHQQNEVQSSVNNNPQSIAVLRVMKSIRKQRLIQQKTDVNTSSFFPSYFLLVFSLFFPSSLTISLSLPSSLLKRKKSIARRKIKQIEFISRVFKDIVIVLKCMQLMRT